MKKWKIWKVQMWFCLRVEGNPSLYTCKDEQEIIKLKDKLIK